MSNSIRCHLLECKGNWDEGHTKQEYMPHPSSYTKQAVSMATRWISVSRWCWGYYIVGGVEPSSSNGDGGWVTAILILVAAMTGVFEQGREESFWSWASITDGQTWASSAYWYTRKVASLGTGSFANSLAGLGLQYVRARTWSGPESSRLPPACGLGLCCGQSLALELSGILTQIRQVYRSTTREFVSRGGWGREDKMYWWTGYDLKLSALYRGPNLNTEWWSWRQDS